MKTSEFAVALVVILAAASVIGGMLYYFKSAPPATTPVSQPTSSSGQSVKTTLSSAPTYSTEGFQETGSVSSVDSSGGRYAIANVAIENPLWVTLSSNQLSEIHYGENFEVKMTYSPNQQTMFDSFGKIISVSSSGYCGQNSAYTPGPCATVSLLDANFPSAVPSSWNPQVGGQIVLALTPETGTPLVAITGFQFSSSSQVSAEVLSPSCVSTQYYGTTNACVVLANGQSFTIRVWISGPNCYGSCTPTSVSSGDPGFAVTGFGQSFSQGSVYFGSPDINITMTTPVTDFAGTVHLSLVYSSG